MNAPSQATRVARPVLLLVGLLLVAATLRAPVTGVAPLLEVLEDSLRLSTAQAGLLMTLPLLAFGFISPFGALLAQRYGLERALFVALAMITVGIAIRSLGMTWSLFLGTVLLGASIAVGNVLLPSLVKRDFPARVPALIGACALMMGASAALMSVLVFPVYSVTGWQVSLGGMALLPVLAMAVWWTQLGQRSVPPPATATAPRGPRIWQSALAWQVTLFMGMNSSVYYVLIAWLPSILMASGFSPTAAGSLHGIMQFASALPGLFLIPLVPLMKDQRLLAVLMATLTGLGFAGLALWPAWAMLWVILFGLGAGGTMLLAFMFMGLRAANAPQTALLSGMAQGVGYLMASMAPVVAGKLHELTGGWGVPLAMGVMFSVTLAGLGLLAGRRRTISQV